MKKIQPAWWKESVIYQIYPRSFQDSNGDGIGDLPGITKRLPYLKELGVDILWLSPIYASPGVDNGYDISDYRAILPDFGTMEDFDELLHKAHALGLRVVMDLVVNHTSDQHRWFKESRSSRENPFRSYYIWRDGKDGAPPNNWGSCFSGSAWQYDEKTEQYYLHLFARQQPDLNWENPQVRKEVYDLMRFWLDKGIDGFRMDVVSMYSKDQRFPDGPLTPSGYGSFAPYAINGPREHEFLQEMNQQVLSHYDIVTVGEAGKATVEDAKKYTRPDGKELNMIFQFEHVGAANGKGSVLGKWTDGKPKLGAFRAIMNKWQEGLDGCGWNSLYLDNHDQPRCVSSFGDDRPAYRAVSAKMLATCLHMMQGTPYIYEGEELGMTNYPFQSPEEFQDIEEINAWKELVVEKKKISPEKMMACIRAMGRDNARTPMQWDGTANAGFTEGTPWLPVNPNYQEINAAAELDDPDSVFHYYQKLIALRHEYPVIVYGHFRPLLEQDESIYAYERFDEESRLVVLCNWTDKEVPCALASDKALEGATELITNTKQHLSGRLAPYEARVLLYRKSSSENSTC